MLALCRGVLIFLENEFRFEFTEISIEFQFIFIS